MTKRNTEREGNVHEGLCWTRAPQLEPGIFPPPNTPSSGDSSGHRKDGDGPGGAPPGCLAVQPGGRS